VSGPESGEARLHRLLSEDPAHALERARTEADRRCGVRPLVLHGSGKSGRRLLEVLRSDGREPVAFSDNDSRKWGTEVDGTPVMSPADAVARFGSAAFIVSIWSPGDGYAAVERQLSALGASVVVPLQVWMWRYSGEMLPFFLFATPDRLLARASDIAGAYGLWADDASRDEYLGQLEWRLTADASALPSLSSAPQYFEPGIVGLGDHEVFVDCGAFNGDTVRTFLDQCGGRFDAIHAFEPDPDNYALLRALCESLPGDVRSRVDARNEAVSDCPGVLRFDATSGGDARVTESGSIAVPCVSLDDAIERATYIKMDIEGAEASALAGARRLITEAAPKLAVCLYHTPEDFFTLPALMRDLCPDADLHCRSYVVDGLDFVAYAVPR
jgi:FkbM family methyltransferase